VAATETTRWRKARRKEGSDQVFPSQVLPSKFMQSLQMDEEEKQKEGMRSWGDWGG